MPRIVINQEQYKKLNTKEQEVSTKAIKSFDSEVQLFDYEPMKKYLVYVPRIKNDDGLEGFDNIKVRAYLHGIKIGNSNQSIRCINGIVNEEFGFTGECPLCEGVTDAWDYYNIKVDARCKANGLDPNSTSEDVKNLRSSLSREREIREPNPYVAFPIVLIESDFDASGKLKLVKDAEGKYKFTPMVYVTSEYNFTGSFQTQLDNQEIEDMCGHFLVLSYVYDTKGKKAEKRDAGRNLNVTIRPLEQLEKYMAEMDQLASFLTPYRIDTSVASFALYPVDELVDKKERALQSYKQGKALIQGGSGNVTTIAKKKTATPEQAISQFKDEDDDEII